MADHKNHNNGSSSPKSEKDRDKDPRKTRLREYGLEAMKVLGKGQFGVAFLVEQLDT